MTDRSRLFVNQYVKSWQQATPSKTYFTDFAGGGVLWVGSSYKWHIFTSSGTWTAPVTSANVIVIGGGGGTGKDGGGGGAGGVRDLISATFVVGTTYTVTVGAAGTNSATVPTAGGNSSITTSGATISATGGGRGGVSGQAASSGGSGGGGYLTASGAAGNAGGYTPVEGFAGAAGVNVGTLASGSGGGATGAAGVGVSGVAWGGGNKGSSGNIGSGYGLPDDLTNCPLFDNLRAGTSTSQYTNTILPNVAVSWGGHGSGYAPPVGALIISSTCGSYTGGIGAAYNTGCSAAKAFGNGGSSGNGTYGNIGTATGGLVVIRYAL